MKSMSDQELEQTEVLLRRRLTQLADHAPSTVRLPGEVSVVATTPRATRARRAGTIAAVTALIGAGGFTTYSFLGASNNSGAVTPEEAVATFVSAIEQEDVLGMIDVTLPEEVAVLRTAVESLTSDSQRVGLLADGFDISGVQGIDVSIDDLVLETNFLEGGLAVVTATGGTLSSSFDPRAFPFGDGVRALLGDPQESETLLTTLGDSDPAVMLVTVQRDDRWYVSLEYTIAEYVRVTAGLELPGPVTRAPVGFDSPEDAVTGFYERLAALDLAAALETFAPGEDAMAWLAQAWLADAQAAFEKGRGDGWSVGISGLTYETIGTGDHLILRPATFNVEGTMPELENFEAVDPSLPTVVLAYDGSGYALVPPGQVPATAEGLTFEDTFPAADLYNFTNVNPDGTINPLDFPAEQTAGPQPFSVVRADGCTTFKGTGGTESLLGLAGGSPEATKVDGGYQLCGTGGSGLLGGLFFFAGGLTELPSVSVVQSDGKWYVSPLGTALATITAGLHDAEVGSSLFDSPIAPLLYGGLSRTMLEVFLVGQSADSLSPACVPAVTIEDGTITGIVADPPLDAVRACTEFSSSSSYESGVEVEAPPVPASIPESPSTAP